ncbi:MAG: Crp/Fnr family transcriptional regulator [Rhodospirillum sp.]|nr:Crp/Fnr family transcriptional regulator [Rhodospirillum sp.]MCF8489051.1 Crp/Fnr family transcriptional regulator [Rhodospirillum sp.]MCF8499760.1 Crp/Fnr family transcriptional regulator [Rhodospirillum sp.]
MTWEDLGWSAPLNEAEVAVRRSRIEAAWKGQPECAGCGIRELALFADLEEEDFSLIHMPIDEILFEGGAILYNAGDQAKAVITLRTGLVKLVQYLGDGSQRIVRLLRPGDTIGLEATLQDEYEHTAVTLRPALACRIPVDVVHKLSRETPRLHRQLMARWHQSVKQADDWLTGLSTGSARTRVARMLLQLPRLSGPDGVEICELFSREDLGAMLGVTTETASRMIAELKRSQVIVERKANAFVCDDRVLREIAGE